MDYAQFSRWAYLLFSQQLRPFHANFPLFQDIPYNYNSGNHNSGRGYSRCLVWEEPKLYSFENYKDNFHDNEK